MRVFRRIVLPSGFLVVLLVIAVALAWMAFRPADDEGAGAIDPTGVLADSAVVVERTTIENSVKLDGTISRDAAVGAPAPESGVVNYFFVSPGDTVAPGAELYQVKSSPGAPAEPEEGEQASDAPPERPVYRTVRAERGGIVEPIDKEVDDEVSKGDDVVSVRPDSYTVKAALEPALLYRLLDPPDKANVDVDKGPEPFDCTGLKVDDGGGASSGKESDPPAAEAPDPEAEAPAPDDGSGDAGGGSGSAEARCTVPKDVKVFDGLALTLTIDAGSAEDVLAVPVTAVRGQTDEGSVWLIDETGEPTETRVQLGLNDGSMVEVKSGVEEGQEVAEFVPGSEPEEEMPPEDGFEEGF